MQTDRLGVSECVRGPLPHSARGLLSFCSPPTPDPLPPSCSPVTNLHFLCIQCPSPPAFVFTEIIIKSAVQIPPQANISSCPGFVSLLSVHMGCSDQGCSLWVGFPFCPEDPQLTMSNTTFFPTGTLSQQNIVLLVLCIFLLTQQPKKRKSNSFSS